MPQFTVTKCKVYTTPKKEILILISGHRFSEQPTLIWEVAPPYISYARHYFANYFDFKKIDFRPQLHGSTGISGRSCAVAQGNQAAIAHEYQVIVA